MSILKQRFLLVSDMHYTTEERPEELKEKYPSAIGTLASGDAFGKTKKIYHVRTANNYRATNGSFQVPETVSDVVEYNI